MRFSLPGESLYQRQKEAFLITTPYNPWGLSAPIATHPTPGQEDPRREPSAETTRTASGADGVAMPEDRVTIGGRPRDPIRQPLFTSDSGQPGASHKETGSSPRRAEGETGWETVSSSEEALDSQESEEVRELKQRDAEVKAHEQAHMAAGGGLIQGGANYTYEKGPDGVMYAVGGEVKIDTSPARTAEQTITKAQQIRRAALAPAQPSATDRAVAAAASQMEAQARAEKARETGSGDEGAATETAARAEIGPKAEEEDRNTPASPFAAPAIQAYQAAAAVSKAAQAISTFA
jgi:hypothetical protein